MSHQSALITEDIDAYLDRHENKEQLLLLTCGSVDDGKSTLIGRLLHDSKMIYEDQFAAIETASKKYGTTGDAVDLALLVDGLQAEREQGITIDVAYRYFSTEKRKFIIADTPGHEQYTRNMVTGASKCELAIILVDARHGVLTQTRRHSYIASLLGIKNIIVAINKIDLVDFDQKIFEEIKQDYIKFASKLGAQSVRYIPISARDGDNVVNKSQRISWYQGPALLELLETIEIAGDKNFSNFRFPVQYVNRPTLDFRGYCGTVTSGIVNIGDKITVLPSGKQNSVKRIVTFDGESKQAFAGQAITLTLDDEIDISRGDVLVHAEDDVSVTNHLKAHLIWMHESELHIDREYLFKFATKWTTGRISKIDYKIDVNTQAHEVVDYLDLNSIAVVDIRVSQPIVLDSYEKATGIGAFIVVDRLTNLTVGAGMVAEVLRSEAKTFDNTLLRSELNELLLSSLNDVELGVKLKALVEKKSLD